MKTILSRSAHNLILLASVVCTWTARADTNRYAGDLWSFVNTKEVLAAASGITLEKYPNCDDATVEQKSVRVYRSDGTGECQDESFTKVLTEKGKRNNRTLSQSFMLPYSTVEFVKLEVLKPDGQMVPVDVAANSKETIDDSQMAMNIYDPNMKLLRVNIPQLEIGDMVHAIVRQTILRSIIAGVYAEENVFEGEGYIRHISYEVHAPADDPLKCIALRDEVKGTVKYTKHAEGDHSIVYRWDVNDVPRMFDEPAMPPYDMVLQRLLVSTAPDWRAVSKWYWGLSASHLDATSPEMKQEVEDLTSGAKTEMDRLKAIFYYVSKNIRYMGLTPEKDRPGFEPHDVKITFDKKYGVCRDKAALLVSMLRAAGFKSYPVLISVGTKRDPEVPDPFFNHAIVSVELKPGEYTLMDPTDEHTRDLLPVSDCDQSYLVCRAEGEDLKVSPIQPPENHIMRVTTTGTLDAAGHLDAKSELVFEGVNDDAYRNAFSHMKPDDQRRFFERTLKVVMPGARLNSLKILPEDMLDVSSVLRADLDYSVEGMTASGAGKTMVSLPWIGKRFGIVNFILGDTGLEKRKYPLQTSVACGLQESIALKLGDGFAGPIAMPEITPVNDDCVGYRENFSCTNGALDCSRELKLKVVEFNPSQYLTLKQTLKSLEYDERKVPLLATTPGATLVSDQNPDDSSAPPVESNARILESQKSLEVIDAHDSIYHVSYKKQILNYAGKIREAEVKIGYNPSCQEARLLGAVVTSKTGQRQEISTNEINVMDEGWNGSAKRYTGGKTLVANLPGVDIGSTIEVEFVITNKGVPFLSGFESFQFPDELAQKTFRLTAADGVEVRKLVSGESGVMQELDETNSDKRSFQWEAKNVSALPAESQLPPEWAYNTGVGYFVGDLKGYLKELNDTMLDRSRKGAKAADLARELTAQSKSRLDALKAIRDYVAKSIRLAGPSFTQLPLSELSAADTTLADGYGHAADRAILLHSMLAAAGFQPELILASALPPINGITNVTSTFPLPEYFQDPLVRVALDGETYYLNDTDQYAQIGSTSYNGRMGLNVASGQCDVIKAAKDCDDRTETDYTMSISENGQTRIGVTRRYYGLNYDGKNRYFSELPPEERRRYYQEIVSSMAQGARPVGDLKTRFDIYPGLEQFSVDVDNYCVLDGKYLYFDLPFTPTLFPAGADHRALPLFTERQGKSTVLTEINLPKEFGHLLISPGSEQLNAPDGAGSVHIISSDDSGKCAITEEFETSPAIIPPKDYSDLLKIEARLGRKSSRVFLLERALD